ncbi:hypothetical protein J437_LFUL005200 [Ladona fulva]|uniref:Flavin-containing monooxygenase n=1 Tax=Ladona fulva TaxID=123851 RepID=A0A8K0JXT9_LADFU|nr:hypothetical protein J437_LFUL005200 [Ladona fulva]
MRQISVLVVGAGAAGLCAARHLSANEIFSFEVFERYESIGGMWVYSEDLNKDEFKLPVHSSIYKSMRHFTEQCIPEIPGIETFRGTVLHSHDYRTPETFDGKRVVIWGASTSAFDIAKDLWKVAKSVVICHRVRKLPRGFPKEVRFAANIKAAFENGFELVDGSTCEADSFFYCTGYHFNFPFLTKECKIEVNDNHVTPLYKHLVNIEYPSMCLVGIPLFTIPFILYDYQVAYYLRTLDKSIDLPSKEEMQRDADKEFQWRCTHNIPARYAHLMNFMLWEYFDQLADLAGLERLRPVVKKILEDSIAASKRENFDYKRYKYEILDDEHFRKTGLQV